jgi:transcriptional regulator GlxA family with amidase domain
MHHALQDVLTTDKPMDWIAGECGFNSALAFSSRFRKKYGVTPAMLRKTC